MLRMSVLHRIRCVSPGDLTLQLACDHQRDARHAPVRAFDLVLLSPSFGAGEVPARGPLLDGEFGKRIDAACVAEHQCTCVQTPSMILWSRGVVLLCSTTLPLRAKVAALKSRHAVGSSKPSKLGVSHSLST